MCVCVCACVCVCVCAYALHNIWCQVIDHFMWPESSIILSVYDVLIKRTLMSKLRIILCIHK